MDEVGVQQHHKVDIWDQKQRCRSLRGGDQDTPVLGVGGAGR